MKMRGLNRPISFVLLLALAASLILPFGTGRTVSAEGENLLINGGFETGTLENWDTSGNDKFVVTDAEKRTGQYGLQIGGPQNWNGIKYTVAVVPNADYTLNFYGKGAGGAAYKIVTGPDDATTLAEQYTGEQSDWTLYSLQFNSGEHASIKIYVSDANTTAYYDDFELLGPTAEVPTEANLVPNGDLETGDLTGWNADGDGKFTVTDAVYHGGQYALQIESATQIYDGIKNTVAVQPNKNYVFSFYMKGSGGSYFKVLSGKDEATIYESQTSASADWKKYSTIFHSGDNTSVIVYVSDMAGLAYFDDFSIAAAIEPNVPEASSVMIEGEPKVTGLLTGTYTYTHPDNVDEAYSIHTWLQSDAADGEYTRIPDSYSLDTYVPTADLAGKYIKFQVTPLDAEGMKGESVTSEAIGPIAAATAVDELQYVIRQAESVRDASVVGSGIGQYPADAMDALEQAIEEARSLAETAGATEDALRAGAAALVQAQAAFDDARIRKPSSFDHYITVSGDKLMDGGEELRFVSFNAPGALFNEDEAGGVMPSAYELDDMLRTIKQMGGKVIRTYTLTVKKSDHGPDVVRHITGPGVLNEGAFQAMDKLLELANEHGVRLIIPFLDHWDWPPGGISDLAAFRGMKETDPKNKLAYHDPTLISDYKLIMDRVMNRINTLTGVRYKDDPAILAWETGNELMVAPAFERELAAHFKKINQNQLFVDGNLIYWPSPTSSSHSYLNVTETGLEDPNFDIVKSHYYSGNYAVRAKEDKAKAVGNKPYFVGEYGLKPTNEVEALLNAVIENDISGALIWSLRPHSVNGGFVRHSEYDPGDGIVYSAYHWPGFPSGDYQDETNLLKLLREKAYEIDGQPVPALPSPEPAPQLFATDSIAKLTWRGSTGASSYTIERAVSPDGPWTVVGQNVLDDVKPGAPIFSDLTAVSGEMYYYRVKGVNASGESAYSAPLGPIEARYVLEDGLTDTSKLYYADDESLVYRTPSSILAFEANAPTGDFTFLLSEDGITFEAVAPTKDGTTYRFTNDVMPNARELKIVYPNGNKNEGKLTRVAIEYQGDGSLLKPVQPLVRDGVLIDELNDLSYVSHHEGGIRFDTDNASLAGDDGSRLVRSGDAPAYIQYRTLGDIRSVKVETFKPVQPDEEGGVKLLGSANGVDFAELPLTAHELGGEWFKTNYVALEVPSGIRYLRVVFPEGAASDDLQISRIEIGVGSGQISLPGTPPLHVIDNGEFYGGEGLLIDRAYTVDSDGGSIRFGLSPEHKSAGSYGLKLQFDAAGHSFSRAARALDAADRSAFDTLQFWVKPDGYARQLIVTLENEAGQRFEKEVSISGVKGKQVNLPLPNGFDKRAMTRFTVEIRPGEGPAAGTIYLDDIQFIQTRVIDDFDHYADEETFLSRYSKTSPVGNIVPSLSADTKLDGPYGLRLDYDFKSDGYGGVLTSLPHVDWTGYNAVRLWVQPNGTTASLVIQVRLGNNEYMETKTELTGGTEGRVLVLPFEDFDYPSWYGGSGTFHPVDIVEFNIYLNQVAGTPTTGSVYLDEIELYNIPTSGPGDDGGTGSDGGETGPTTGTGGDGGESGSAQLQDGVITVQPVTDNRGQAVAAIGRGELQTALQQLTDGTLRVQVLPASGTKEIKVQLPADALAGSDKVKRVRIDSGMAVVEIQRSLLGGNESSGMLELTISLVEPGSLPPAVQSGLGGAAVYDFELSLNGEKLGDFASGEVAVSIPYTLQPGENPKNVVVYYVKEDGALETVVNGKYSAATGQVRFYAKHFSQYAAAYADATFQDIATLAWAKDSIEALAVRGIVQGVGNGMFQPNGEVTRAAFVHMLMRAFELVDPADEAATFRDVEPGKWYSESIASAQQRGIVQGRSDGTFGVNERITRQDMTVLLERTVRLASLRLQEASGDGDLTDLDQVSEYAQEAVRTMFRTGIVNGKPGGRFAPHAYATRAEAAVMLERLFEQQ